jgi:hypothetical protein
MIQKFRKKPVVIEALQWHIDVNAKEIEKFVVTTKKISIKIS